MPRTIFLGILAIACAISGGAVGCGSAGGGDLDHINNAPVALGTPIHDANDPTKPLVKLCGTYVNSSCGPTDVCPKTCPTLQAKGVVVTGIDQYDETGDGKSIGNIYVQDPVQSGGQGTPYSGLTLFQTQLVPSDLPLQPGDGVDISGEYQPFPGPGTSLFPVTLPEMVKGSLSLSYEARPPEPVDITVDDLKDMKAGMSYVGRLVRMKNVTVSGPFTAPRREAPIDGTTSATGAIVVMAGQFFAVDDPAGFGAKSGSNYSAVVGVLNYFFNFKLCPRTPDDFTP
jgi:hypothetical protein